MLEDCQDLDLRRGVLTRRRLVGDNLGHLTRITHRRFVHMGSAHLAALEITITPQWSGRLRIRSELDGTVTNSGVPRYIDMASVSGAIEVTGHAGSILGQHMSSARVNLRMSAGRIEVTFSAAPATIAATVAVGSITLRVPRNVPYAVDASTSVGSTSVSVNRSAASPHAIMARVTTGSVTIEPAP